MPSYSKLKVARLRQLCDERDIVLSHFVALRTFDSPRRPRVSEVGLWNQHRSGGLLGQWPTRPSSLNSPLDSRDLFNRIAKDGCVKFTEVITNTQFSYVLMIMS